MHVAQPVLEGYLSNKFKRESWRVPSMMLEDYVQEGLLIYLTIEKHYKAVTEPKHLMALFKSSWSNHIHDKSRLERYESLDELMVMNIPAPEGINLELLDWQASKLSADAQTVLQLLSAPGEAVDLLNSIVPSYKQVKSLSAHLAWDTTRFRTAMVELLQEFSMPSAIQILATATGLKQSPSQSRNDYLMKLVEATANLPDPAWNALSPEAQEYYNQAAAAVNARQPVPDLPDEAVKSEVVKPISEARQAHNAKMAAKRTSNAGGAAVANDAGAAEKLDTPGAAPAPAAPAQPAAPAAAASTAPAPIAELDRSPTQRARELMALDTAITPAAVRDILKAEGYPIPAMSSLQAMRSDIRAVLKVLAANGRLKEDKAS